MIAKQDEMKRFPVPGLCGGTGTAEFTLLFDRGVLPSNVVKVTLAPGASCGSHDHTEDTELFYVLEGELCLLDDGIEHPLKAGDCEYCPVGHSHGAVNRSDKPASYLAVTFAAPPDADSRSDASV